MTVDDAPAATLAENEQSHGFTVEQVTALPGLRMTASLLRHARSGARLLHLAAHDPENLFSVAFKTPPPDNSGLPHILEHTVLCGSEKYPVKDPFNELVKTSLASFLNAMTYPDKTVYPCASMNRKDFQNLAKVYCDAVFHPLLTEAHFKQEGHHFDFKSPGDVNSALTVKGIVYNEMKGAYASLNGVIEREEMRSILPDNAYGLDSGGDPDAIESLTYAAFTRFHQNYYHPSNAYFFTYGDIPIEETLAFLDQEYLSAYEARPVDTTIAAQPRWTSPRHLTIPYPVGAHEDLKGKAAVTVNFLTCQLTDTLRSLAMAVLESYLLDNAASPLRKALEDSKLGESLTRSGYADYVRDTYFTVGMKGSEPENAGKIVALVQDVCRKLAKDGLERDKLETVFHKVEFSSKEIGSSFPLTLMDRVFNYWLNDSDPLCLLKLDEHLETLRRRHETEPRFFENILMEEIVDNQHYSVLTFVPDKEYFKKTKAETKRRHAKLKATMAAEQLQAIAKEAEALEAFQSEPNSPEALATLPKLSLGDVSPTPQTLDTEAQTVAGRPFYKTNIFSNGVNYLTLAIDLAGLDPELGKYLPVFCEAMTKMGAGGRDYLEMAEREASLTGALGAGVSSEGSFDAPNRFSPYLFVSTKALDRKLEGALGLVGERLLDCDFSDLKRLKDLLLQKRANLNGGVVSSGSHYASLHAARGLNGNLALTEQIGGIGRIRFYNHLADHFDEVKEELTAQLRRLHAFILQKARFSASFVGDDKSAKLARERLAELYGRLGDAPLAADAIGAFAPHPATLEGLAIPTDVSFNAAVFATVEATHPLAATLYLISQMLDGDYLWDEIRVKRGAYGAKASYSTLNGVFTLSSYPRPLRAGDLRRLQIHRRPRREPDGFEPKCPGAVDHRGDQTPRPPHPPRRRRGAGAAPLPPRHQRRAPNAIPPPPPGRDQGGRRPDRPDHPQAIVEDHVLLLHRRPGQAGQGQDPDPMGRDDRGDLAP